MTRVRRDANAGLVSQLGYSLSSLNEARRLRQKARESWERFITNKIVYQVQGDKAHPLAGKGYLEQYLSSEAWFEVLLSPLGHSYTARAILEYLNLSTRAGEHWYDLAARDFHIDPVLVSVPQPVENGEGVVVGVPTMCWLEVCDIRDGARQDVPCQVPEVVNASVREVANQREGREFVGLVPRADIAQSKIPSDVIQCRAEVMDNVTEDRGQRSRRRAMGRDLVNDIVEVLRIELSSESLRVSLKEGAHLPFEFVKVFARPFNLEPATRNVAVHEVYSDHEQRRRRNRSAQTENREGRAIPSISAR